MHDVIRILRFLLLPALLLLGACQQISSGGAAIGVRDHADAVTHLGQVDPSYRSYFSEQHGRNYSIADQRKAFFEAVRTSRTPVNQDARHMPRGASPKKPAAKKKPVARKKTVKKKNPSKGKKPAKKKRR